MFDHESAFTRLRPLRQFVRTLAGSALTLTILTSAGQAFAGTQYDGNWSVLILTRRGACEPTVRYGIEIIGGKVVNTAGGMATVDGRVSSSGAVRVSVQAGGASAYGSGRLRGSQGGGRWRGQGMSGACEGTWTAERHEFSPRAQTGALIFNYSRR